jgi:hypothetical protein
MEVIGERHASAALAQGKNPGTHLCGGWVDAEVGLDVF